MYFHHWYTPTVHRVLCALPRVKQHWRIIPGKQNRRGSSGLSWGYKSCLHHNQPRVEWIPVTQLLKHITVLSYHRSIINQNSFPASKPASTTKHHNMKIHSKAGLRDLSPPVIKLFEHRLWHLNLKWEDQDINCWFHQVTWFVSLTQYGQVETPTSSHPSKKYLIIEQHLLLWIRGWAYNPLKSLGICFIYCLWSSCRMCLMTSSLLSVTSLSIWPKSWIKSNVTYKLTCELYLGRILYVKQDISFSV